MILNRGWVGQLIPHCQINFIYEQLVLAHLEILQTTSCLACCDLLPLNWSAKVVVVEEEEE